MNDVLLDIATQSGGVVAVIAVMLWFIRTRAKNGGFATVTVESKSGTELREEVVECKKNIARLRDQLSHSLIANDEKCESCKWRAIVEGTVKRDAQRKNKNKLKVDQ